DPNPPGSITNKHSLVSWGGRMAVAIVTGAGCGIGAATARILAHRGDRVVCADVKLDTARQTAERLPDAIAVEVDVSSATSCDRMVEETVGRYGDVDAIVEGPGYEKRGPGHEVRE